MDYPSSKCIQMYLGVILAFEIKPILEVWLVNLKYRYIFPSNLIQFNDFCAEIES